MSPPGAAEQHRPKRQDPLEHLALARPELAARARAVAALLQRIEPLSAQRDAERFDEAMLALEASGVLPARTDDGASPSAQIDDALLALSLHTDASAAAWELVLSAAAALGSTYAPNLDAIERATSALADRPNLGGVGVTGLLSRIAALATARGGADLVQRMKPSLRTRPEPSLAFLELVCAGRAARDAPAGQPQGGGSPTAGSAPLPPGVQPPAAERRPPTPLSETLALLLRSLRARRWVDGVGLRELARDLSAHRHDGLPLGPAGPSEVVPERTRGALVSSGFSAMDATEAWPTRRALQADTTYRFWVEIGDERPTDAIETDGHRLISLPSGTELDIAVFGFDDELQPVEGADQGRMRLVGSAAVAIDGRTGAAGGRRLWLSVRTGAASRRTQRLRWNVYRGNVLLQSRVVTAQVRAKPSSLRRRALASEVDFSIARDLTATEVATLEPIALSVMINDNGHGTHGFRFFGGTDFKQEASIGGAALEQLLEQTRGMLRRVTWGDRAEPSLEEFETLHDRYATPDPARLAEDLIALARTGFRVWDALVDGLSGGQADALQVLMQAPGRLQIANRQSAELLVPAACIYDHPLTVSLADVRICPAFASATGPLPATECFQGRCPSYASRDIVCPSGFWGFRHEIGYSADLPFAATEGADTLSLTAGPGGPAAFVVGASTDPDLTRRDAHLTQVRQLAGGWQRADSASGLLDLFGSSRPSVVYLYGHGGGEDASPFFVVGDDADGPIRRADLRGAVDWRDAHPLVFLNGCRSSPLRPGAAFSYASGFLHTAHAAGVIGTEISVFESLATAFAEECLRRFVANRESLGAAVRSTRVQLLEQGTPLGLAYLAFGPLDLQLAA
ncbi:hypothetical protein [Agrococcus sp. Marseille-P2731]|uniref:hypothetical protein n=1 Tax=Agrococcus sp. Marseille-P2731 TaxID=1841862 RepID=UPI000930D569|nr:hypothetical protein [Agrococcus sp. Marseille-P2731]